MLIFFFFLILNRGKWKWIVKSGFSKIALMNIYSTHITGTEVSLKTIINHFKGPGFDLFLFINIGVLLNSLFIFLVVYNFWKISKECNKF